jgi:acyl-CoA reductase-like NAD-dependent aldehyde dehydrogenase
MSTGPPAAGGLDAGAAVALESVLRRARDAQRGWARLDLPARAAVVAATATGLAADAEGMARSVAAAQSRGLADVWSAEIVPTLDALRWLVRRGARWLRPEPLRRSRLQWYFRATRHELWWEPYGVVGIVTPANGLLFLSLPQVAAALLAGNAVVWKPAPVGTEIALAAGACFRRAGLAAGLLEIVPGGAEMARALVATGVDKLFFTGGSEGGRALYRAQAAAGRPAVLELSGRHVALVLDGVDPVLAARGIVWGKLAGGGRHCVSIQLVLVERAMAEALTTQLRRVLAAQDAGAPPEAAPRDDPVSRRGRALAADAVERGARLLHGDGTGPTLLVGVAPGMRVVEEEIQGPILAVAAIEPVERAITWVNTYRLSASVWCADPARARRLARARDVGQVWINEQLHPTAQPEVTLAGRGASGFGASRGWPGLLEMVQPKVVSETPRRAARRHYGPAPEEVTAMFRSTVALAFARGLGARLGAVAGLARALARLAVPDR